MATSYFKESLQQLTACSNLLFIHTPMYSNLIYNHFNWGCKINVTVSSEAYTYYFCLFDYIIFLITIKTLYQRKSKHLSKGMCIFVFKLDFFHFTVLVFISSEHLFLYYCSCSMLYIFTERYLYIFMPPYVIIIPSCMYQNSNIIKLYIYIILDLFLHAFFMQNWKIKDIWFSFCS